MRSSLEVVATLRSGWLTTGPRVVRTANHKLIREIEDIDQRLNVANLNESWHDLQQIKEQVQTMFEFGLLTLDVKARVESDYWELAERMQLLVRGMDPEDVPEDLRDLKIELADQHICNFSVFQSLLDHWALGQLFPIVPIHRLNQKPHRLAGNGQLHRAGADQHHLFPQVLMWRMIDFAGRDIALMALHLEARMRLAGEQAALFVLP